MLSVKELINILEQKKYRFKLHEHKPFFTVEESKKFRDKIRGAHSKNLFLKNKKINFFYFLVKKIVR